MKPDIDYHEELFDRHGRKWEAVRTSDGDLFVDSFGNLRVLLRGERLLRVYSPEKRRFINQAVQKEAGSLKNFTQPLDWAKAQEIEFQGDRITVLVGRERGVPFARWIP